MNKAIQLIHIERQRQRSQEGFTPEHDDNHRSGELSDAAQAYVHAARKQARGESHEYILELVAACEVPWPWEDEWWKPSASQIRNLVKAGALIVAEIERLQRIEANGGSGE